MAAGGAGSVLQALQQGQGEACGLAGARLGGGLQVAAGEDYGDGAGSGPGWARVALFGDRTQQFGRKAEGRK